MFRVSGFIFRLRPFGLARYSTLSGNSNSVVDYLIHSLNFSKQDAIFLSSKGNVTHLISTINSDLVVTILKNYGLNNTQIKQIVYCAPRILNSKPTKTLEPKVRVFKELGLSGSDLVRLIKKNPTILWRGLHSQIIPFLDCVRKLVGSNENVINAIINSNRFSFSHQKMRIPPTNISLLQNYGLSNERIIKFVVTYPNQLLVNPNLLKSSLSYVEDKLGISRDLGNFIHAVPVVLFNTDSQIKKKMQIFSSFGWSDYEIATLLRAQPNCLNFTESYLSDKLKYFMKELNYTPSVLIRNTHFWTLSLEKRIKPRNQVFNILKEKELVKDKPSFATIVKISEPKFLCFLKSFENHVPRLCDTYMNSIMSFKCE
ncbi:transcription termination factor MTERF15, mitochondrial-like [Rutidosis leptorrhynchoides]|uniref:transcription termination factor MTERF15, mitochondrial-like n=1 Tax=Rutidosis leptorrhynchoides TaxID=125765 RepID=UPI003A9920C0